VRIERDPTNPSKPPDLVVSESVEYSGAAQAGIGGGMAPGSTRTPGQRNATDNPDKPASLDAPSLSASASGKIKVTAEQRMPLPSDVSAASFVANPAGTAARLGSQFMNDPRATMSVSVQTTGQLTANAGRNAPDSVATEKNIKVTGNPRQIMDSGALGQAFHGNVTGALQTLAPITTAEASTNTVRQDSQNYVDLSGGVGLASGGVSASATRTDKEVVAGSERKSQPGDAYTGTELIQDLATGRVGLV
jgi:hypothetical protein